MACAHHILDFQFFWTCAVRENDTMEPNGYDDHIAMGTAFPRRGVHVNGAGAVRTDRVLLTVNGG